MTTEQEAQALRDAIKVMRRRFGGLGTTIAVLEEKAGQLERLAAAEAAR